MSRLGGQDGTGDGQVGLVHDGGSSSEVSGDTDVLEDSGQGGERLGVGVRELVGTRLNSGAAQGSGEEGDVGGLVLSDLGEPLSDPGRETSGGESGGVELVESLVVEGVLEVFEGQGVVQDGGVIDSSGLLLLDGRGKDTTGGDQGEDGGGGESHLESLVCSWCKVGSVL